MEYEAKTSSLKGKLEQLGFTQALLVEQDDPRLVNYNIELKKCLQNGGILVTTSNLVTSANISENALEAAKLICAHATASVLRQMGSVIKVDETSRTNFARSFEPKLNMDCLPSVYTLFMSGGADDARIIALPYDENISRKTFLKHFFQQELSSPTEE